MHIMADLIAACLQAGERCQIMSRMKQISIDVEVNRVIEANRNAFSESENDILRRLLLLQAVPAVKIQPSQEIQQLETR